MNKTNFTPGFRLPAVTSLSGGGIIKTCLTLLLLLTALTASALDGKGTESEPYLIKSSTDWESFRSNLQNAYYRLDADITVYKMVEGTFTGTFDGNGHTINFYYTDQDTVGIRQFWRYNTSYLAPFRNVSGATFKNLRMAGQLSTCGPYAATIAAQTTGNATTYFYDCISTMTLYWPIKNMQKADEHYDLSWGGFVGQANAPVVINNCWYDGAIKLERGDGGRGENMGSRPINYAGFVGWSGRSATISNSLMTAFVSRTARLENRKHERITPTGEVRPFARGNGVNINNCYFNPDKVEWHYTFQKHWQDQGTRVGTNDIRQRNGELSWLLQAGQSDMHWGQTIGTDTVPQLTHTAGKRVYRAVYTHNNETVQTSYVNTGKSFPDAPDGYTMVNYNGAAATSDLNIQLLFVKMSEDGYVLISNKDEWDLFTTTYDGTLNKYRLTADITDAVTTTVGTSGRPFSGVFDGQGHKLTVNYVRNEDHLSPFKYINGATISNLCVTGTITSNRGTIGCLAGEANGNASTFINCESAVNLTYTGGGDATCAGFLGRANTTGGVIFNNCSFSGSITAANGNSVAGFLGWINNGGATFNNCLMAGTITAQSGLNAPFARRAWASTVNNCYYRNFANIHNDYIRGTVITDEQLGSGAMAYILQNGQSQFYWGQTVGTSNADAKPVLTSAEDKHVYKASLKYGNEEKGAGYANKGRAFVMDDMEDYTLLYNNAPAEKDTEYQLLVNDQDGYALIHNNEEWNVLANNYSGKGNFRLTADLQDITTMVSASNQNPFRGTFDGQGHTLSVNYTSDEQFVAPFRYISGATITNLRTAGTISGSKSPGAVGGLAGDAVNEASTISNCESAMNLIFTGQGDATHGGFLGRASAPVNFQNCAFTGSMTAANGNAVGGFVGWADRDVNINDCLVAADIKVQDATSRGTQGNACFGRHWELYKVKNSYVVRFDHINVDQGTYITNEQLQSGAMAYMLQGEQGQQYWGQTLGNGSKPMLTGDNAKRVYKAVFTFESNKIDSTFANNGKGFAEPSVAYKSAIPSDFNSVGASKDISVALTLFNNSGDYQLIDNINDWNYFAAYATKGNYRMTTDISGVTSMAGTNEKPFTGTFDGAGHTLGVNYTANEALVAPFRFVAGATIRNLNVTGTEHMTGTDKNHCSGLIGSANGATIERCTSSVALTFDNAGDAHSGGLVGHAQHSTITISDCAFTGSISQPEGRNESVGGLIGWGERDCKAYIKNSYVDMTLNNIAGQNNLVRALGGWTDKDSKFDNCYYTIPAGVANNWDPEPATLVTKEQMQSGYVANLLQNGHAAEDGMVWGQNISNGQKDARPVVTSDASKRVYKATFTFEDDSIAYVCTNSGKTFPKLSAVKYASTAPADYASQPANKDITVALNLFEKDKEGNWLINSADDWNNFTIYSTKGSYRLGKDISGITTTAGTTTKPFTGVFDGQNNTLTVSYDFSGKADDVQLGAAPFRFANGATIRNLRTAGIVTTSKVTSDASGLIGEAYGKVTIDNCESAAAITYNGNSDATNGGLIGRVNDNSSAAITNCAFTGSITSERGSCFGGLIGWVNDKDASATITNSLVAADINVQGTNNNVGNAPFARNATRSTVTNSYYRNFANICEVYRKGEQVTADQLKSGEVAFKLQASQQSAVWGQTVGEDEKPVLTDETDKRVIETTYDDSSKAYDNYVVMNENKGNKKLISNYTINGKANVKLVRTFAEGWNTLVLPFSLTTEEVEEAFGADTKVAYFTNTEQNAIELSTDNTMKDIRTNTPVLIKPSKAVDEIGSLTFPNKQMIYAGLATMTAGANGISFVGSYDALYTVKAGDYFINDTCLWKSAGNTALKATRAYFAVPEAAANAKITLYINEDGGTTTGANAITVDGMGDNSSASAVYTLSGQKVADSLEAARRLHLQSGVYIVSGKKIVIK